MIRTSKPVLLRDEARFAGEDASIALGVELVAGCTSVDLALTRDAADVTRVGLRCGLLISFGSLSWPGYQRKLTMLVQSCPMV